jgi:hypothetical protein
MPRRRRLLSTIAAAVTVITAGCGRFLSSNELLVEFVEVVNLDESSHVISVVVEKDDDVVVNETVELEALSEGEYDSTAFDGPWLDRAGDFVVRAQLSTSDTWREADLSGSESSAVGIEVLIDDDASLGIFTAL